MTIKLRHDLFSQPKKHTQVREPNNTGTFNGTNLPMPTPSLMYRTYLPAIPPHNRHKETPNIVLGMSVIMGGGGGGKRPKFCKGHQI